MTEDNRKYFDNYLDLFIHPGWKQFVEEMQEVWGTYNYDLVKNYEDFLKTKSAREQLDRVINFEAAIRFSIDRAEEEEDDEDNVNEED